MKDHRYYLDMAFEEADAALAAGTYPIGAVIVGPEGEVIARGRNRVIDSGDISAHAEVDAIRQAGGLLRSPAYKHRCTIYTTVEPCLMCTGALIFADIDNIVWAMSDDVGGAMRIMHRERSYMSHKWGRVTLVAAPYPDLNLRMRRMHAEFDDSRGLRGAYWLEGGARW